MRRFHFESPERGGPTLHRRFASDERFRSASLAAQRRCASRSVRSCRATRRQIPGPQNSDAKKRVQHPTENDYGDGVNVGVGLGPTATGEAEGDGLDEAIASLALASSNKFFSSA
jgi:hypothetical protein